MAPVVSKKKNPLAPGQFASPVVQQQVQTQQDQQQQQQDTQRKAPVKVGDVLPNGQTVVSAPSGQPQTFQIGNTMVSKEIFDAAKNASPVASERTKLNPEANAALTKSEDQAILNQMAQKNIVAERQRRILEAEGKRLGIIPDQPAIQAPTITPPSSASKEASIENELQAQNLPDTPINRIKVSAQLSDSASKAAPIFASTIDSIRGIFTGKKPLAAEQATQTFNQLETDLRRQIGDLQNGTGDAAAVNQNLQQAADTLSRLIEYQHTYGLQQQNLRYWIDHGAEVEADAIDMQQTIAELTQKAKIAELEGNIARTQAIVGLSNQNGQA